MSRQSGDNTGRNNAANTAIKSAVILTGTFVFTFAVMRFASLAGASPEEKIGNFNYLCLLAKKACEEPLNFDLLAGVSASIPTALSYAGISQLWQWYRGAGNNSAQDYNPLTEAGDGVGDDGSQVNVVGSIYQGQYPNGVTPSAPIVGAENPNGDRPPTDGTSQPSQTAQLQNIGSPLHSPREETPQDPALDNAPQSSGSPSPSNSG